MARQVNKRRQKAVKRFPEFKKGLFAYNTAVHFSEFKKVRRNLPNYERAKLALKLEPIIKARAKLNKEQAMATAREKNPNNIKEQFKQKSAETVQAIETRKELAKIAGVSHDTIGKVKIIENEAPEEIKEKAKEQQLSGLKKEIRFCRFLLKR